MIIEASNTYFGGGYVLLEELLRNLEQQDDETLVYVGYKNVYEALQKKNYQHITFIKTGELQTLFRYLTRRKRTLFFCSLPPFVHNERSVVYAHNPHFIECPKKISKYLVYYYWVRLFRNKVDFFACQTNEVAKHLKALGCQVQLMPFYVRPARVDLPKKYDFCYISTVAPHKNHQCLFEAVEQLVNQGRRFSLAVTVRDSKRNAELIAQIRRINEKAGMQIIVNRGFVSKSEMAEVLNLSKTVVFPSLKETFGLPIAEALSCGLRILSSDRPYTYDLLAHPIVFDPKDSRSIAGVMADDLDGRFTGIVQQLKIQDSLKELLTYLNK